MKPREPAGWEWGRGKSAEFPGRARRGDGLAGNTCGTVCGNVAVGALSAKRVAPRFAVERSVEACLYRFFMPKKSEKMEGTFL